MGFQGVAVTDKPDRSGTVISPGSAGPKRLRRRRAALPDAAFDLWLDGGLRAMYDDVAKEAVPPELLALLQDPQKKP
jgi:hypothetical protein